MNLRPTTLILTLADAPQDARDLHREHKLTCAACGRDNKAVPAWALPGLCQSITLAAKRIGWPRHAVLKRALKLGLSRSKEAPWSDREISLLQQYGYLSDEKLVERLKSHGFTRTATAVHLKVKRQHIHDPVRDHHRAPRSQPAQQRGREPGRAVPALPPETRHAFPPRQRAADARGAGGAGVAEQGD